jgi:DNA-cytosine methyltransferase
MFTGYGGAEWGLKMAGIDYELVGYSEISKIAIQCYEQNFTDSKGKNFGDCSKIDAESLPDFDLLTGGFPCQDVSIAGKRDLSKGRTTLFDHIIRIASIKKPKHMILENVKGLLSTPYFKYVLSELHRIGYDVTWKLCNSKEHGIPQNRERVWFMCKLGQWDFNEFNWPNKQTLTLRLSDLLEHDVPDKYYLTDKQVNFILDKVRLKKGYTSLNKDVIKCQHEGQYSDWNGNFVSIPIDDTHCLSKYNRIYDSHGESCTLVGGGVGGGGAGRYTGLYQVYDDYNNRIKDDDCACAITSTVGPSAPSNNQKIIVHNMQPRSEDRPSLKYSNGGSGHLSRPANIAYSLDTGCGQTIEIQNYDKSKIRKLTPIECFRLMGFLKDEVDISGLSDTSCYKLAGNGWDVHMASLLIKELLRIKK